MNSTTKFDIYRTRTLGWRAAGFALVRGLLLRPGFAFLAAARRVVAIERGGVAVVGVSVLGLSISRVISGTMIAVVPGSIEQRSHSSVRVVMILAISIMQTGLTEDALNFLAQRIGNERRMAFAAGDAAHVRGVDIEQYRDPLVDTTKYRERFKRVRDTIGLVTIHDFL